MGEGPSCLEPVDVFCLLFSGCDGKLSIRPRQLNCLLVRCDAMYNAARGTETKVES